MTATCWALAACVPSKNGWTELIRTSFWLTKQSLLSKPSGLNQASQEPKTRSHTRCLHSSTMVIRQQHHSSAMETNNRLLTTPPRPKSLSFSRWNRTLPSSQKWINWSFQIQTISLMRACLKTPATKSSLSSKTSWARNTLHQWVRMSLVSWQKCLTRNSLRKWVLPSQRCARSLFEEERTETLVTYTRSWMKRRRRIPTLDACRSKTLLTPKNHQRS